jgi:hypothetical protein
MSIFYVFIAGASLESDESSGAPTNLNERNKAMSDLGSSDKPTLGTLSHSKPDIIDEGRADLSININGYRIEAQVFEKVTRVTIDGREMMGSFTEAIKYASSLPTRWNGLFD